MTSTAHAQEVDIASQTAVKTRMIVIPHGLESFFYSRLSERYKDRRDVQIVIDRRSDERRRSEPSGAGAAPLPERRNNSRRNEGPRWSLPDMPVATF